ncbi:MAG TPA: sulfotransferase [Pyrinomonadaceae bacterium]|nr:sulfotransferase [Pyrinomonadaceae bacterium]
MGEQINKPIFVVGSPRSGTSILTWCLGQHPNIFPVPESNWMGEFAINVASSYQIGAARENRTVLSAMDISRAEFFANFGHAINDLILGHRKHLERKRDLEGTLNRKHSTSEQKARWVDGTPEYSLHIHGLRKLFPEALFVHIVRDVDSVVRSMLNFHRVAGTRLVTSEEQAYKYWLRMVDACLKAEQSYGPRVIYRLQYAALIDNPEAAIRSLLDFVDEPYSAKCLEPLGHRINSSNVPVDFKSEDPATDPKLVNTARQLYAEIQQTPQPAQGSPALADQLEAELQEPYFKATRLQQELSEEIAKVEHYIAEVEQYKLQLARQEQHYASEIEQYKSQLRTQERHYAAEIEEYKTQLAKQEQHYTAEVAEYKSQLVTQEQHYAAQAEEYKSQLARQEHHYAAEIEQYKSQIASQERHYTGEIEVYQSRLARLCKQLHDARKLSRLLDNVESVGERLAHSRRWKLANVGPLMKAKLSGGKTSIGYDPLDKIIAAYSQWRASHPAVWKLDEENMAAEYKAISETSATRSDIACESKASPVSPPAP